jgi:Glycosyl hydrolases family 25
VTIYFPDVSSYQAGLDLAGALAVLAKGTEGTGYTNPEYGRFRDEAARHGTFFAAYHFLSAGNGAGQAAHAHAVIGKTPCMLDFEPAGSSPSLADATAFIDAYRKAGGVCWLVYLPRWYWQQIGSPALGPLRQRGMLLVSSNYAAGYTDAGSGAGWQAYGGMAPTVWQYSSTTPFNRQQVDFNAFRGSYAGKQDPASVAACLAEFRSLASTGKPPGSPPPPPAAGPYRHEIEAGNTQTWAQLCKSRNVTEVMLATFSLSHLNAGNAAVLTAYLALCKALAIQGHRQPPMPAGLVYWTVHP